MFFLRKIVGHSMEPRLKAGRVILARQSNKYRKGDVVIAKFEEKEVVKMVQKIKGGKLFLAGNSPRHDLGWVDRHSVRGRMIWPRR